MKADILKTDILIIGAGMAGFRAAVEARDLGSEVIMTTKGLLGKDAGATWMAHKGYQCWGIHAHDTIDLAAEDTIRCGWFLNNQENVYAYLAHVPDTARDLLRWGGKFKMKEDKIAPDWQLGQSIPEGRSLVPAQWPRGELGYTYSNIFPRITKRKKVHVLEDFFVIDLLVADSSVVGALGIDINKGRFIAIRAKTTILATGGYLGLYPISTGNTNLTGDGQAIALRAGADMMDFEFNQTLPSALWPPEIAGALLPFNLIMEWDAHMYNSKNERFMEKWDPVKMERSTRSLISRGIFHEIKEGRKSPHGGVFVSAAHNSADFIEEKFRQWGRSHEFVKLAKTGIDLSMDGVETAYSIHYSQGGCSVNTKCETDIMGLYAIGEVASGAKDGSDRMMSNALPYCMAMGIIAGREASENAKKLALPALDNGQVQGLMRKALAPLERNGGTKIYPMKSQYQNLMQMETCYGRTEEGLKFALGEIEKYKKMMSTISVSNKSKRYNFEWIHALEFENLLLVGECLARNALMRTESRGLHDRWDFPKPDKDWFRNIHLRWEDGELKQWTTPVEFKYWMPIKDSLGEPKDRGVQVKQYEGWVAKPLHTSD
jgi:succinate dehydrogenase/fumarate reductase flavoprotein subunit